MHATGRQLRSLRKWDALSFSRPGIPELKYRGLRGLKRRLCRKIWGVNIYKYYHLADLWPLNKQGEMIFGVKIEDTFCDQDYEKTIALPGISMAEWGLRSQLLAFGLDIMPEDGSRQGNVEMRPEMVKVRQNVLDACKKQQRDVPDGADRFRIILHPT